MRILPGLAALALADSSSFGTFDLPIVMLVQRRVRAAAVLIYLASLAAFYWCAGMLIVFVAAGLIRRLQHAAEAPLFGWIEAVSGAALTVGSLFLSQRRSDEKRAARADAPPSLVKRWQARLVGENARLGSVAGIALGVGVLEIATMLPFLGAMALVSGVHPRPAEAALMLGGYVVVMIAPALVMLALRVALGPRIEGSLERLHGWIEAHAVILLAWVLRVVGAVLMWDGVHRILRVPHG